MYNKMDNKQKVLNQIFENPIKDFHIRLLARKTGLNPNTIIKITDELVEEDLITKKKEKETNKVIIKANYRNNLFLAKKKAHNIEKIVKSQLLNFLDEELEYPTIIIFGSYAKAENDQKSDIDLFILCDKTKKLKLSKFKIILGSEIQIFLHSKKEFSKLKEKNKELINNVINGTVLSGYFEVL